MEAEVSLTIRISCTVFIVVPLLYKIRNLSEFKDNIFILVVKEV